MTDFFDIKPFNPRSKVSGDECYIITLYDKEKKEDLDLKHGVSIIPYHRYKCKYGMNESFEVVTYLFNYFYDEYTKSKFRDPKLYYKIFKCKSRGLIYNHSIKHTFTTNEIYVLYQIEEYTLFNQIHTKMTRNELGELESFNDEPALIQYTNDYKMIWKQEWYKNGQLHRENNSPAKIRFCNHNRLIGVSPYDRHVDEEGWYINGIPSREDKTLPTFIHYTCPRFKRGKLIPPQINVKVFETRDDTYNYKQYVQYWHGGAYHKLMLETYEVYKRRIRDNEIIDIYRDRSNDLPSTIQYYSNGKIKQAKWYKGIKLHREGYLPAVIHYDKEGGIIWQKFYIDGEFII